MDLSIKVAARSSNLSRAQLEEVEREIQGYFPQICFEPRWTKTHGDGDLTTSLRLLDKTDFFTREVDHLVLSGNCRIAIHSAKDLPQRLPVGLSLIAITRGVDGSDALVLGKNACLADLPIGARIGTSSLRREKAIKALREDLQCVDVRGTIEMRLSLLDSGKLEGLVVAEAALIRLGETKRNRLILAGKSAPLQGQLAVVARIEDQEMERLFAPIDTRARVLYLGTDPEHFSLQREKPCRLIHYPVIALFPRSSEDTGVQKAHRDFCHYTHILFTSKNAVAFFCAAFPYDLKKQTLIAIGTATAQELSLRRRPPDFIAEEESAEGLIKLLQTLVLKEAFLLLPRSSLARELLTAFLEEKKVRYFAFDLYDTKLQKPGPSPALSEIDEIVFTSPSTVRGFLALYDTIPQDKILHTQGPITKRCL